VVNRSLCSASRLEREKKTYVIQRKEVFCKIKKEKKEGAGKRSPRVFFWKIT
jgi:hypothetical protein